MKSFPIKLFALIILFSFSCIQEEKVYDYQYLCGDFYANGELGFHSYIFCSVVPIENDYFYKKGYWEFYDKKGGLIASSYFRPQKVTYPGGGCPYDLIEVTVTSLKNHSKIHNDSVILSKIENCFSVELKNGKSKLLQEKEPAEILNINWNGLE